MRKVTKKRFERILMDFYADLEYTQEEKDELYKLYSHIESIGQNLILCLKAIKELIFIYEEIDQDNVDYLKSFNIDYSLWIFSNKLVRQYSFKLLVKILILAMREAAHESMVFFENRNPELWAKRMGFYKSKLKKVCVKKTYIPMIELLDELFRILIILRYNLKSDYSDIILILSRNYTSEEITLFANVYKDKSGNSDESVLLSNYLFSTKKADEIINNYELAVEQKELKKLSKE